MVATKLRKITVSIRSDLIDLVDSYVKDHKRDNISRSAIVEKALLLWGFQLQQDADECYFSRNARQLNADAESWMLIATESARRIWR